MGAPMSIEQESILAAIGKPLGAALMWLGSWKLSEFQMLAGTASAICVGAYAAMQAYVLWRDKIKRKE